MKINNPTKKFLVVVNSATILVSLYKINFFILEVGKDLFEWWIPQGQVFSYIHFWQFVTFFLIPLPFGLYFIALAFYLLAAIILLLQIRKKTIDLKIILFSCIILLGVIGSFVIFIGE